MQLFNNETIREGFTLMEAIVAIFVVTVGIVGVLSLVTQTISSATISKDKLIAAYLAQEGIEIVRNIRDTNWVGGAASWDTGISYTSDYRLDYQSSGFPDTNCNLSVNNYLKYDGNYYNCSTGNETKFKRKIIISQPATPDCPAGDCLNVSILVQWEEKGTIHSVAAQENLYNWH